MAPTPQPAKSKGPTLIVAGIIVRCRGRIYEIWHADLRIDAPDHEPWVITFDCPGCGEEHMLTSRDF